MHFSLVELTKAWFSVLPLSCLPVREYRILPEMWRVDKYQKNIYNEINSRSTACVTCQGKGNRQNWINTNDEEEKFSGLLRVMYVRLQCLETKSGYFRAVIKHISIKERWQWILPLQEAVCWKLLFQEQIFTSADLWRGLATSVTLKGKPVFSNSFGFVSCVVFSYTYLL